jgi:hypothetical protein
MRLPEVVPVEHLRRDQLPDICLETGLQIRIAGLIGAYTDPHILIAYSDGEVRQEFTFVYAAEIEAGELKIDDESKGAAWMPLSSAVELPLAESQGENRSEFPKNPGFSFVKPPSSITIRARGQARQLTE